MSPDTAAQILAAWMNEHRDPVIRGARIMAALNHVKKGKYYGKKSPAP